MRLDGKIAVITGGTNGMGAQMARQFSAAGARVVITGRSEERGRSVAENVRRQGGVASFIRADLRSEGDMEMLGRAAVSEYGGLHVLINCAAPTDELQLGSDQAITDLPTENFRKIIDVGIYGLFWTLKYCIPHIRASGGGSIVNISSGSSLLGQAGLPAYSMIKGAMNSLTRQIAVEYAPCNIRCNAILAGFISGAPPTDLLLAHPVAGPEIRASVLTRMGVASDVANMAQFLASEASGYITGALLTVDGGITAKAPLPDVAAIFAADKARLAGGAAVPSPAAAKQTSN